jgi:hypothetical protein
VTSEIEAAVKAYRRARKTADERYAALVDLIIKATIAGVKQADIVRITGYTRDNIRQMLRSRDYTPERIAELAAKYRGEQGRPE